MGKGNPGKGKGLFMKKKKGGVREGEMNKKKGRTSKGGLFPL